MTGNKSHLLEAPSDSALPKKMLLKCRSSDVISQPNILLLRQGIHIEHPRCMVLYSEHPHKRKIHPEAHRAAGAGDSLHCLEE